MGSTPQALRRRRRTGWRPRVPVRRSARLSLLGVALACVVLGLGGCGHTARAHRHHLAAAEPDHDHVLAGRPAGRSVRVGVDPQGIAVNGAGDVAVGVHNPSAVVVMSAETGHILRRVAIAAPPRHMAVLGSNGPFLVPEEEADRLLELSVDPLRQRSYVTGDFPHAVWTLGGDVFVGNERGHSLTEIFPDGRERTIRGFTQPGGEAAIGGDLAVVDVATFTLSLMDGQSGRILARLPAGAGPTHDAADSREIYVLDTRGNAVLTYTAHPFRQIGRLPLAVGPYGVALDPRRDRLWVTLTGSNRLAELSTAGRLPRLIRTYATGLQPDTVAVDERTGRVFVANQVSGTVEIIEPPN